MSTIGKVDSLWRYPVKSMRGEELEELFAGFPGIYGDRVFAFRSSANHKGFPYLTARDQRRLLQYRPRFRNPEKAALSPLGLVVTRQPPAQHGRCRERDNQRDHDCDRPCSADPAQPRVRDRGWA